MREVSTERNKPHCFELYSAGNEVIKACKTDSEGKVVEGNKNNIHFTLIAAGLNYNMYIDLADVYNTRFFP